MITSRSHAMIAKYKQHRVIVQLAYHSPVNNDAQHSYAVSTISVKLLHCSLLSFTDRHVIMGLDDEQLTFSTAF